MLQTRCAGAAAPARRAAVGATSRSSAARPHSALTAPKRQQQVQQQPAPGRRRRQAAVVVAAAAAAPAAPPAAALLAPSPSNNNDRRARAAAAAAWLAAAAQRQPALRLALTLVVAASRAVSACRDALAAAVPPPPTLDDARRDPAKATRALRRRLAAARFGVKAMAVVALPLARAGAESLSAVYARTFEKAAFGFAKMYLFCLFMRVLLSWFPGIDWNVQPWAFLRLVSACTPPAISGRARESGPAARPNPQKRARCAPCAGRGLDTQLTADDPPPFPPPSHNHNQPPDHRALPVHLPRHPPSPFWPARLHAPVRLPDPARHRRDHVAELYSRLAQRRRLERLDDQRRALLL
jgi:hypothetical protein